jgi:hypothetical protein
MIIPSLDFTDILFKIVDGSEIYMVKQYSYLYHKLFADFVKNEPNLYYYATRISV